MRLRLLVVSYGYPPVPYVGSARWAAMTAHLRKLGHDVLVVTTSCHGRIAGELDVARVPDLFAGPAVRRLLGAPPLSAAGYATDSASPPLHERLLVPDPKLLGWLPGPFATVRRLLRRAEFDCLITASPFESTHLLGLALGPRRPAWVADLQDGWIVDPWRAPLPWRWQRQLDRRLERLSLTRADAVTAATGAVAADLERRLGRGVHHVTNGWDPDLEPAVKRSSGPAVSADRVTLVYTGTLWKTIGQDPGPLFGALRRLAAEAPEIASRLELVIAGPLSDAEARRLTGFGLDGMVRHVGQLSRPEAVALQRRADALVLVASAHRNVVTGKIFEYLASGRPILALAGDDDAAAVIRETGTGIVVPRADESAIAAALRDLVAGRLASDLRPHGLDAYRYPAPAHAMLDVAREAIALRLRSRSDSVRRGAAVP